MASRLIAAVLDPSMFPMMTLSVRTFFYPLQGIIYFAQHPILWGNLILLFVPQITLTFGVIILSYMFLYPPQAVMAFVLNGPTGLVGASIGMMQQSLAITRGISELFLFPRPLRILFDGVLVQEGCDKLVLAGRLSRLDVEDDEHQKVFDYIKTVPRKMFFPKWFFKLLFRIGLTFIPIVGPAALILLDARPTAVRCQGRYFELKNWDDAQVKYWVRRHWLQYMAFGVVSAALEAIPVIGFVFLFTNTAAGALWAINTERAMLAARTSTPRR